MFLIICARTFLLLKNSLTKEYCSDFERVNKFILCYLNIIDSVTAVIIFTFSFSHDKRPILKYCHRLLKIYPLLLVLISATKYHNKYVQRLHFCKNNEYTWRLVQKKIQFNGIFKLDFSILHVGCHNNSSVENGWYVRL